MTSPQRIETSRRNFERHQVLGRDMGGGSPSMANSIRAMYQFLKALPPGSPVDAADHFNVLTTREERMEQVERFAKRWRVEL